MFKKVNLIVSLMLSFLMVFSLLAPELARAAETDKNQISSEEVKELVNDEFYLSEEEAEFFEELSDEEYYEYLKNEENKFGEAAGDYVSDYFTDDSYDEQYEIIIEDGYELELYKR